MFSISIFHISSANLKIVLVIDSVS